MTERRIRKENIFFLLEQEGPFATRESAPAYNPFSRETREWVRTLKKSVMATNYRVVRNQIAELLDIRSFGEIRKHLDDYEWRSRIEARAYRLLGNMFGIEGNDREVVTRINAFSRTADGVINYLKAKVLANYAPYIEMTNEIDTTKSPVELLLIVFDDRYHRKARFEAKRKLILMKLAASIDQRERETDVENKFLQFLKFLNDNVWSGKAKIGELEIVYLLSHHSKQDFSCEKVKIISREEAVRIQEKPFQKLTLIKRRRFRANAHEVPIYVSVRKKPPEAKVLKLLRKNQEDPAVAVDDELGLMGVVESVMDVKSFQKHLTRRASKAGTLMTLEDISDTLSGENYTSSSVGSSAKTPMFKFFARLGGMRVEFIVHTHRSYLNYIYQRGVSHDEYEVKRLFDTGVAELLFPQDIYHLDMEAKKDLLVNWFRRRIEDP